MVFFLINHWHFKASRCMLQWRAFEPKLKRKDKLLSKS